MLRIIAAALALLAAVAVYLHASPARARQPVQLVSGECYSNNFCTLYTKDGEQLTVNPSQHGQNKLYQPLLISRQMAVVGECSATGCTLFARALNLTFEASVMEQQAPTPTQVVEIPFSAFKQVMSGVGTVLADAIRNPTSR